MKRKTIIFSLLIIWVPFVFITDFYPFMRLGMFAEPIRSETQTERFQVYYFDERHDKHIFESTQIGLAPYVLEQLAKNHFYRNEPELFLEKLASQFTYNHWKLERKYGAEAEVYYYHRP